MTVRKKVGRLGHRTADILDIWLSLRLSAYLHPWPNPSTDHGHAQIRPSFPALPSPAIRLGTHGFPCQDFALQVGFSFLAVVLPGHGRWVQLHCSRRWHADLEQKRSSLAPRLQDRIHVLGIEPAKSCWSHYEKILGGRGWGSKGRVLIRKRKIAPYWPCTGFIEIYLKKKNLWSLILP